MSVLDPESSPDPDLVSKIWDRMEQLHVHRAAAHELENELLFLLTELESLNLTLPELLRICNEPLLIAQSIHRGRHSNKMSLSQCFYITFDIAQQLAEEND